MANGTQSFNYEISAKVKLDELPKLEQSLQRQIVQAQALGKTGTDSYKQLLSNLGAVRQQISALNAEQEKGKGGGFFKELREQAEGAVEKLREEVPAFRAVGDSIGLLKGPLGIVTLAVGGLFVAFDKVKEAFATFAESQNAVATLDAALANSGQLTDGYREKLQDLANTMEELTAIDDDKWLAALGTLTKFGATSDNIDQYADAVKNLAGFMGGDIEQAAFIFGKAMQGSTGMIRRYGIQIDESLDTTSKLDAVMRQLAERGGGQLEARAKTLSGQWAGLKIASEDFFKALGNLLSRTGLVQGALEGLAKAINAVSSIFPSTIERVGGLTNKLPPLKNAATAAADSMDELGEGAEGSATGMGKAESAADKVGKKLDDVASKAEKARQALDSLDDANEALEKAQVDQDEAEGKLTHFEALQKKADIENKYTNDKIARLKAEAQANKDAAQAEIDAATNAADGAKSDAKSKGFDAQLATDEAGRANIPSNQQRAVDRAAAALDRVGIRGRSGQFIEPEKVAAAQGALDAARQKQAAEVPVYTESADELETRAKEMEQRAKAVQGTNDAAKKMRQELAEQADGFRALAEIAKKATDAGLAARQADADARAQEKTSRDQAGAAQPRLAAATGQGQIADLQGRTQAANYAAATARIGTDQAKDVASKKKQADEAAIEAQRKDAESQIQALKNANDLLGQTDPQKFEANVREIADLKKKLLDFSAQKDVLDGKASADLGPQRDAIDIETQQSVNNFRQSLAPAAEARFNLRDAASRLGAGRGAGATIFRSPQETDAFFGGGSAPGGADGAGAPAVAAVQATSKVQQVAFDALAKAFANQGDLTVAQLNKLTALVEDLSKKQAQQGRQTGANPAR